VLRVERELEDLSLNSGGGKKTNLTTNYKQLAIKKHHSNFLK